MLRSTRRILRGIDHYIRHDLREIIAPSSLPNPPGYVPPPPLTISKAFQRLRFAVKGYIDTWNSEKLREELRKRGELPPEENTVDYKAEVEDVLADLSAAAKGGSKAMKPYLQNLYQTRVAAYRDAVQQFIHGYKDGFEQGSTGPELDEFDKYDDAAKETTTSTSSNKPIDTADGVGDKDKDSEQAKTSDSGESPNR